MLAKFDDERAGAGIPLPEGQAVTLGRAHIPAGIVAPLHRTQVSRQHVRLTRQGRVVHIEVVRGRRFEAALPALVHADPPQVSATHAVLVQWQGADHASWQKLDPQGKGQLTVGDRFALHPGVDRPVAFRLVDAAEGAQTPSIGASAGLRAEAAAREGLSASVEGSQAPTPGVGGLAEKRPRRDAPEGTGSSLTGSGPGEESPPPRRRRKVTFHPDASVAGAASQDGTARLRDASAPPPPQPAPAPAAGGGEGDGGALAPARADVTTRPGVLAPGAALAAAVPAHTPPLGGSETADGSSPPSAAAPAAEATRPALSEAAVPAWGGGRGTEVLEGRRRTAQGDEVHATVLVEGREVRIKRKVHSRAPGASGAAEAEGGGPPLGPGAMDVTVTRHGDAASALRFARAALGLALSTDADRLVARELETQCGADVRSRVLLRGWDCSVCSFGNRVENPRCEVCGRGRRPQTLTETL